MIGHRAGFTLIDILVSLILLVLLSVAVFTIVVQQMDRHHATLLAHDMVRIGTGVEMLNVNVYPVFPSDIEDLIYRPEDGDVHLDLTTAYSAAQRRRWAGPYVDVLSVSEGGDVFDQVIRSGFNVAIESAIYCFDAMENKAEQCDEDGGQYVALLLNNITVPEFEQVNDIIDGEGEDDTFIGTSAPSWRQGRLRIEDDINASYEDLISSMFFLIRPYSK